MRILQRLVAVLFVAIGAFLIYAVIHAAASKNGARVGVCILYVVITVVLVFVARWLWRRTTRTAPA